MDFEQVTEEHILKGIADFNQKGMPNGFGPSSTYDLVYEGKRYPPKAVMAYANYHAIGRKIERYFKGGLGTDCFNAFERNGFDVVTKNEDAESLTVKKEFARWLLENATVNYQPYYGRTIDSVTAKLNEINEFFDKDLFSVNKNNYKEMISYIKFKNGKKERIKNRVFYDYDRKHGKGRPIAILGHENYSKFLNAYFSGKNDNYIDLEEALQPFIKKYKSIITSLEDYSEIYKWEAIQNFQNHWDLESTNFISMLETSFPGNENLWAGSHFLPINMLKEFANIDKDTVIEALKDLLDEKQDLQQRIPAYISVMDRLLNSNNESSGRNDKSHYQDARAISLLLAFKYPTKHSLFKYSVLKKFCEEFELEFPKAGHVVQQILVNNEINRAVKKVLVKDDELIQIHQNRLTPHSFKEDDDNILTQDFIYSVFAYDNPQVKYYLGGSFWSDEKPKSQTERFVKEGIWVNGYKDKFTEFVNAIPVGSQIALKSTHKRNNILEIFNVGTVLKNYNDGQKLDVEWKTDFNSFKLPFTGGYWETIVEVTDSDHIDQIFNPNLKAMNISSMDIKIPSKKIPLNQILYGPPGTGKTYNTVNLALEICGETIQGLDRKAIKRMYDEKIMEAQIIFSTFHQSMSYEDFIEGIKPIEPEKDGDPVIYTVIEGIFKKACIEASFNFALDNNDTETDKVLDFSLAYDNFIQKLEERLASESEVELEIKNGGKVYVDSISSQGNIQIKHLEGLRTYTVSKTRLSKLQKAITNLDEISNINDSFRAIIGGSNSTAYWSVLNAIQKENHFENNLNNIERKYSPEEKREAVKELDKNIYKGNTGKPIVLIIDEINRGNVSAIFGELITLIEKDKRLGADEALLAQLPYSKEYFGVPPNLYIIGTMNTADRSVEALDSALRRRFSFTEMPPLPECIREYGSADDGNIDDIDLVRLLQTINNRIEKLLDKDHAIGHSYFLKIKYLKGLKAVFANKVIPLLQEYFFGDYGKIGLVMGSGFVESVQGDNDEKFFAPFEDYELGSLVERKVYRIKDAKKMSNEEFKKALLQLLG